MNSYKDLVLWQKAMALVKEVYRLVKKLPREEQYALSEQIRRSAVSIPSNIAEGYGRNSKNAYIHFLKIARGSKFELETQLLICVEIGYLTEEQIAPAMTLCDEIGRITFKILSKISA